MRKGRGSSCVGASSGHHWRSGLAALPYLFVALAAIGCAAEYERGSAKTQSYAAGASAPGATTTGPNAAADKPAGATGEAIPPAVPRKIIYNAQITLVAESLTTVEAELTRLVAESGGYVAETDVSGVSHERRQGSWKVRVPADRFSSFVAAVGKLGEMQQSHVDSQDVTQEYYDLEARISNKQQEEKRLLKHLDETTGKLEDILTVERELSRVRGEVEQMQGRLRFLANLTSLSTITITATELKHFTPPVEPTFAAQVGRTFRESFRLLTDFAKGVVLVVVAAAPWIAVLALVAIPIWLLVRIRRAVGHPRWTGLPDR
jgi:hypothetical protein